MENQCSSAMLVSRLSTRTSPSKLIVYTRQGCERIFSDRTSGARADRRGLRDALGFARDGDLLLVWKLDRLSRSLSHLVETVQELERRGIGFRSLTEGLDTSNSGGKAIFPLFAAIASVEKNADARAHQGGVGGCPSTRTRWWPPPHYIATSSYWYPPLFAYIMGCITPHVDGRFFAAAPADNG
jgi:Resolvase, N terminal domain